MDYVKVSLIVIISALSYWLLLEWSDFTDTTPSPKEDSTFISPDEPRKTIKISGFDDSKDSLTILKPAPSSEDNSLIGGNKTTSTKRPSFFIKNEYLLLEIDSLTGNFIRSELVKLKGDSGEGIQLLGNRVLSDSSMGTYTANSGYYSLNDNKYLNPSFSSLNTLSMNDGKKLYVLNGENGGFSFIRKILIDEKSYSLSIEDVIGIKDDSAQNKEVLPYVRIIRDGLAHNFEGSRLDNYTYLGPVFSTKTDTFNKIDFEDIAEQGFQEDSLGGWFALVQRYFVTAWVPPKEGIYKYQASKIPSGLFSLALTGQKVQVTNNSPVSFKNTLYVGPKYTEDLNSIHPDLGLVVDYGFLWWLGQPIYWLMVWGFGLLGNWGFAIIFSTVILKLVLWPLSSAGYKSAAKMRALAPKIQELQSRHSGDRVKLGQETMAFYKKEGVSPLGGCLPMLLQFPFFIAFYWVLLDMVELRHSPFILWIADLSSRDPYFILPIFNGVFMYFSQKLMPITPSADPTQQQMQQMMKYMPIFVCVIFAWFPAGFVLYFLVQTILTLVQQALAFRSSGVPVDFKES